MEALMEEKLATAEKKVLIELVKLAQKRGMKGTHGDWKEFLNHYDKKLGASLSDPRRRSNDVLAAFLMSFTQEDDVKILAKAMQCHSNRDAVEQLMKNSPENESSEQRLVHLTVEHPQYPLDYSFPSHEEGWVIIKLSKKSTPKRSNVMVAVDCEMVLCEDGSEALVRVCVVDHNLKVKLNELVKPEKAVADYRTEITGVTAKDLEGVTSTLSDIQKSMTKLLSHGTILIGHSLNNDLQALKLDHPRVIDTSFIFRYSEGPVYRRPSLNNLCKSVLGYEVRKKGAPHNCLDDACAAMKLVLAKIERGIDTVIPLVQETVPEFEMAKLLFHRIPIKVPVKDLYRVIPGDYTIEPKPTKKTKGENYSALAIFKTPEEAHQAFESVKGSEEKDTSGLPQKLLQFQLSTGEAANLYVRKMVKSGEVLSKKRAIQDENAHEPKKLKIDKGIEGEKVVFKKQEDDRIKEIDSLKQETERLKQEIERLKLVEEENEKLKHKLSQKDFEVSKLHKIISNLKKK